MNRWAVLKKVHGRAARTAVSLFSKRDRFKIRIGESSGGLEVVGPSHGLPHKSYTIGL